MAVSRDTVKGEVNNVLASVSGMHIDPDEHQNLQNDLLLTAPLIGGLAVRWTRLSESHGGEAVSREEAGETETVKDCIDLVFGKVEP